MLRFELKKLYKSKLILIAMIYAFLVSIFANYRSSYTNFEDDFGKFLPVPSSASVFVKAN